VENLYLNFHPKYADNILQSNSSLVIVSFYNTSLDESLENLSFIIIILASILAESAFLVHALEFLLHNISADNRFKICRQAWPLLDYTVKCKGLVGLHQSKSHYSGQALFRTSMRIC